MDALGPVHYVAQDEFSNHSFAPELLAASNGTGPLKCYNLVDNNAIGRGLTFSSADIMDGVAITIFDLTNHTSCVGPYGAVETETFTGPCMMKMVGRITKDMQKDIRTMSNIVMVEASFQEDMPYYGGQNGQKVFKAVAKDMMCMGVEPGDYYNTAAHCVRQYATAYGCKTTLFSLNMDDPCYKDITYDGCVDNGPMSCNDACPVVCADARVEDPMWEICQPTCNMSAITGREPPVLDFCAPGCNRAQIADGMCDVECFNEACHLDGGDCSGAGRDSPYLSASRIVSSDSPPIFERLDKNRDALVDEDEFKLSAPPVFVGVMSEMNMRWTDRGFNIIEFSAVTQFMSFGEVSQMYFQAPPGPPKISIDDIMDSVVDLDKFAIGRAVDLMRLYDWNLDGSLQALEVVNYANREATEEAYRAFLRGGLYERDAHEHFNDPLGGSADKLANILYGIYVSLSGRRLTQPAFDNKGATFALMTLLDVNSDGVLSFSEISLAGISPAMAKAIDSNMDSMIDEEEFLGAQMRMAESGCAGTTVISDRNEVIMTKPPLTGSSPRNCTFYILPNWFYPSVMDYGSSTQVAGAVMSRRSGSVHARASTASHKDQKNVYHMTRTHSAHAAAASRRSMRRSGHEEGTVHHDASPGEMGEPVELDKNGMDFVVKIYMHDQFLCMGAMIRSDVVIVSGGCAAKIRDKNVMMAVPRDDVSNVQAQDAYGNMLHGVSLMVSPGVTVGENAFGLIHVHEDSTTQTERKPTPVELHDGGGLDLSDCREKMVAVGLAAGTPTPFPARRSATEEFTFMEGNNSFMAQQYIDVVGKDNCSDVHGLLFRVNRVLPRHACGVAFHGARKMCFADGHLLLARHPENRAKWILVGIADEGPSCDSPLNEHLPTLFNEIASELPWVLSAYGLGRFPPLMLAVEASDLNINEGDEVHVNSPTTYLELGNISSPCEHGGEYYDMAGDGSLSVLIRTSPERGQQDTHIKLSVRAGDCSESAEWSMSSMGTDSGDPGSGRRDQDSQRSCSAIDGCIAMPDGSCGSRECMFTAGWKYVTQELQSRGKAFTGGLGGEAEVNGQVEYRQWMCARDWNVEEQLSCGLGPGEIGCFRFDEKAVNGSGFEWYGRNDERKIVSERKRMDGVAKQRRGLTSI